MTMVPLIDRLGVRTCCKRIGSIVSGYATFELIVTAVMLVAILTIALLHTIAACVC